MEPLGHAPSGPASFASERRVAASRAWQNAYEPSPAFTEPDQRPLSPRPSPMALRQRLDRPFHLLTTNRNFTIPGGMSGGRRCSRSGR